jgi:hypothetical protein
MDDQTEARAAFLNMVCMMFSHWINTGEESGWIIERYDIAHTRDYVMATAAMDRIKAVCEPLTDQIAIARDSSDGRLMQQLCERIDWAQIALDHWNEHRTSDTRHF